MVNGRHAPHWCRMLLALVMAFPLAAVEVTLQLPDPLVAGVVLRGGIVVENSGARIERIDLPMVEGLEWQTGRGASYEVRIVNGNRTNRETMPLALRAQQVPEIVIPAITVVFDDGSTATTKALTVKPQAPDSALSGEVAASASFEPATIVPGEPAMLVYRLALRQDRVRAIKQPALTPPTGLLVTGERTDSKSETVDAEGREWSVQTWRWPVTASQPGTYEARGQQEWYRCRHDFFNQLVIESTHQVAIRPGALTVTALPDAGRPDDFNGLIGPLEASAALDRTRISAGEGAVFTLTLKGPQISLARRPTLMLPADVQAYPKDDDDDVTGERHFRWDLVPGAAGEVTLPALAFPFFDPQTRTYRRTSTTPLTLTVLPGRNRTLVVSGNTAPTTRPAATPVVDKDRALPPPLRGGAGTPAPVAWSWALLGAALVLGACIGLGQRLVSRPKRGPHRGKALAAAIVAKDLDAMSRALFALRPDLGDDERRAADALEHAIDQARFGARADSDFAALAAPLVGIA